MAFVFKEVISVAKEYYKQNNIDKKKHISMAKLKGMLILWLSMYQTF